MKVIGIIGARKRDTHVDYEAVKEALFKIYKKGDWLCSGRCKVGGDHFAEKISEDYGIPIMLFPPNKKEYGIPAAYFVRNTEIARFSEVLIACVEDKRDKYKGGTGDTIKKFEKAKRTAHGYAGEVILV